MSSGVTLTSPSDLTLHAALPEGVYHVTLELDGGDEGSVAVVTAESRRSMLQPIRLEKGERRQERFAVWLLTPTLENGSIKLADRERGIRQYDDQLTLDIVGTHPAVASLKIEPASDVRTIFLAGDSTVTDQPGVPWSSWGAMLPSYFDETVAVANLASSGQALRSFRADGRLEKILSLLQPDDYVLIQFGHNDQKEKGEGIGAFESYSDDLRQYVDDVRERGGKPILVTSVVRRRFDGDGKWYDTLGDFPEAVRRVAKEKDVPLVDLHAMSRRIVEALGEEDSKAAYVHFAAGTFAGQGEALSDDSHFSTYGGDVLARAVVEGLKDVAPDLAEHLREDVDGIDLDAPPPPSDWTWPEPGQAGHGDAERPVVPEGS